MKSQAVMRLVHRTKVAVGGWIGAWLRRRYDRHRGSVRRLCPATTRDALPEGCAYRPLLHSSPYAPRPPRYHAEGPAEQRYLKMLAESLNPMDDFAGVITASGVDVSLPVGMHLWGGRLFEEAILMSDPSMLANPKYVLDLEAIPYRRKQRRGEAVLLTMPWHHNFFHWLVEILPRLLLYDRVENLRGLKLIVPAESPKFVRESLEVAGYADRVEWLERGVYHFERLHLLTRISHSTFPTSTAISWLRDRFAGPERPARNRIYVSRADALIRFFTNEDQVRARLEARGFQTVVMSRHSLPEQAQIFRDAGLVFGPHGASMSHLAFAEPGTPVIDVFKDGHFNACIYNIANVNDLKYGFLVGRKDGLGMAVDLDQLEHILDRTERDCD